MRAGGGEHHLRRRQPTSGDTGTVSWTTTHEVDLRGFNVVLLNNQGTRIQENTALIPCQECITGFGASYSFIIPKHKNCESIFVEIVRQNGTVETFGPSVRQ